MQIMKKKSAYMSNFIYICIKFSIKTIDFMNCNDDNITRFGKSIKSWAEDDRPREKLMNKGIAALSDSELLAILLGSGYKNKSAVDLARDILKKHNDNLNLLSKISFRELMQFPGIGEAKAITVVAALELGRRRKSQETVERKKITTSKDVFDILQASLGDIYHEEFHVIYLNRANDIISIEKISQGGITETTIDVKIILKQSLLVYAQAIILAHNHPSGNKNPSAADITLTQKVKTACSLFDIKLFDHIIITDKGYFSFAENEML